MDCADRKVRGGHADSSAFSILPVMPDLIEHPVTLFQQRG
jgi:hypothetical protein